MLIKYFTPKVEPFKLFLLILKKIKSIFHSSTPYSLKNMLSKLDYNNELASQPLGCLASP
jgi:hypothetical protein